jgi:hypothetical protein
MTNTDTAAPIALGTAAVLALEVMLAKLPCDGCGVTGDAICLPTCRAHAAADNPGYPC